MVYVVERYLPGLSRSDLLRGLSRLEQAAQRKEAPAVRYLGSTIVLGDEACFCQFEGPSEAAVAEANRKAGLPFDRIVPALNVMPKERGRSMSISTSAPVTVEMRRSRLLGLVAAVAAVAAAITWAVLGFTVNAGTGTAEARPNLPAIQQQAAFEQFAKGISLLARAQHAAAARDARGLNPNDKRYVMGSIPRSIMDLTPGDLASGLLGYEVSARQSADLGGGACLDEPRVKAVCHDAHGPDVPRACRRSRRLSVAPSAGDGSTWWERAGTRFGARPLRL